MLVMTTLFFVFHSHHHICKAHAMQKQRALVAIITEPTAVKLMLLCTKESLASLGGLRGRPHPPSRCPRLRTYVDFESDRSISPMYFLLPLC